MNPIFWLAIICLMPTYGFCCLSQLSMFNQSKGLNQEGTLLDVFQNHEGSSIVAVFATSKSDTKFKLASTASWFGEIHIQYQEIGTLHNYSYQVQSSYLKTSCGSFLVYFPIKFQHPTIKKIEISVLALINQTHIFFEENFIPVCTDQLTKTFSPYLSLSTTINDHFWNNQINPLIYENQIQILQNWILYHLSQGFDHITIYLDFLNTNFEALVLKAFSKLVAREKLVLIRSHPGTSSNFFTQVALNHHAIARYEKLTEWLAIADIDEFFQPMGKFSTVREVLRHLEPTIQEKQKGGLQVIHSFWATKNGTQTLNLCEIQERGSYFSRGGRSKVIIRPLYSSGVCVHYNQGNKFRALIPNPDLFIRLNHFKMFGKMKLNNTIHDDSFSKILSENRLC